MISHLYYNLKYNLPIDNLNFMIEDKISLILIYELLWIVNIIILKYAKIETNINYIKLKKCFQHFILYLNNTFNLDSPV